MEGCTCGLSKWLSYVSVDCESRRARWVSVAIVACFYVLECGRSSTLRYVRDVRDAEAVVCAQLRVHAVLCQSA